MRCLGFCRGMVCVPPSARDLCSDTMNQQNLASDIWNIADTLRGDFKQSEFGRVILPFAVLRRLECVLEPTSC